MDSEPPTSGRVISLQNKPPVKPAEKVQKPELAKAGKAFGMRKTSPPAEQGVVQLKGWKRYASEYCSLGLELAALCHDVLEEGDGDADEAPPEFGVMREVAEYGLDIKSLLRLLMSVKKLSCVGREETEMENRIRNISRFCPAVLEEGKTNLGELKVAISILMRTKELLLTIQEREAEYSLMHEALEVYPELLRKLIELDDSMASLEEKTGKEALVNMGGRKKPTNRMAIMRFVRMRVPKKLKGAAEALKSGKGAEVPEMEASEVFSGRKEAADAFQVVKQAYDAMLSAAQRLYEDVMGEEGAVVTQSRMKKRE